MLTLKKRTDANILHFFDLSVATFLEFFSIINNTYFLDIIMLQHDSAANPETHYADHAYADTKYAHADTGALAPNAVP